MCLEIRTCLKHLHAAQAEVVQLQSREDLHNRERATWQSGMSRAEGMQSKAEALESANSKLEAELKEVTGQVVRLRSKLTEAEAVGERRREEVVHFAEEVKALQHEASEASMAHQA